MPEHIFASVVRKGASALQECWIVFPQPCFISAKALALWKVGLWPGSIRIPSAVNWPTRREIYWFGNLKGKSKGGRGKGVSQSLEDITRNEPCHFSALRACVGFISEAATSVDGTAPAPTLHGSHCNFTSLWKLCCYYWRAAVTLLHVCLSLEQTHHTTSW